MRTVFGFRQVYFGGIIMLLFGSAVLAQVPNLLNYQGRISVNTTNFTGTGQFKFALITTGTNSAVQATATITVSYGFVVNIPILNGGRGYVTAPSVTITDSTGSGARAYSQVYGGVVTNIIVTATGSAYSASPGVVIAPPPQQAVTTTFWSNDGTSNAGGEPSTGVPLAVSRGLYSVQLGDTTLPNMLPLTPTALSGTGVSLRVWFNDGTTGFQQMSPDQRLAAVAYAIMASTVPDGSITAAKIVPGVGGFLMDQISGSTNIQTTANNSYLLTNTIAAATLALPSSPKVGDKVRITGNSLGWVVSAPSGQMIIGPCNPVITSSVELPGGNSGNVVVACSAEGAHVFAAQQNGSIYYASNSLSGIRTSVVAKPKTFAPISGWKFVVVSSNGSRMVALDSGGAYLSTDYGATWKPSSDLRLSNCLSVASSTDGSRLLAGQSGGGLFTSSDFGVTWALRTNAPTANWEFVASSADGIHLIAVQSSGTVYTSGDSGATWTLRPSAPRIGCVASSADGSRLVAANGSGVYVSSDYGGNWILRSGAPPYVQSVASSIDGSRLLVAQNAGGIFTSADYGVTWTNRSALLPEGYFSHSVAFSGDGSRIVDFRGSPYGPASWAVYTSADYGATWTRQSGPTPAAVYGLAAATSADGRYVVAVLDGGAIQTSSDFGVSWGSGGVDVADLSNHSCNWSFLASSTNGRVVIAAADRIELVTSSNSAALGAVFRSTNYGARFDHLASLPGAVWSSVASSSDGSRLAVSENNGRIFVSTNSGSSWVSATPHPSIGWDYVTFASGERGLVAAADDGSIGISKDLGVTWTIKTNLTNYGDRGQMAVSADGSRLFRTGYDSESYYSYDGGSTWATSSILGRVGFQNSTECSTDGTRVVIAAESADIVDVYLSPDSAHSWSSSISTQTGNGSRHGVASSSSGTQIFVADTSKLFSIRGFQYQLISGGPFASCELVYVGNGQWQISSSTSTILGL